MAVSPWSARPILVTGGAGFIGSNIADALLAQGEEVLIFDNFSRAGSSTNVDWLRDRHGERAVVHAADIRDATRWPRRPRRPLRSCIWRPRWRSPRAS